MLATLLLALQTCPVPLDLNTTEILLTGDPEPLADLGGKALFVAQTIDQGRELWVSDGTAAGTQVLLEIQPGAASPNVFVRGQNNGLLFFAANDAAGREMWVSDGTQAGTFMLADISPGAADSDPTNIHAAGSLTYFAAEDPVHGYETWVTDGTSAGTHLVEDFMPGTGNGSMPIAAAGNGVALGYTKTTNGSGTEPHYITSTSVTLLGDLTPGSTSTGISFAANVPGTARFVFARPNSTKRLFTTDGTPQGTTKLVDVDVDSEFVETGLAVPGTELFFIVEGSTGGRALWHTDGSLSGTGLFMDFAASQTEYVWLKGASTFNGEFYFTAKSADHGQEVWKTDGTVAGTNELVDWLPGTDGVRLDASIEFGGELYLFLRDDQANELILLATGGTAATTRFVSSFGNTGPTAVQAAPEGLYFVLAGFGVERLWFCDGTTAGTALVDGSAFDEDGVPVVVPGGVVYLHDAGGKSEVWKAAGAQAGLIEDLEPVTKNESTFPSYVTPLFGRELWMMYDTPTGDEPVRLVPGQAPEVLPVLPKKDVSADPHFTGFWTSGGTRVAFVAPGTSSSTHVLWITDGTVAGTLETNVVVNANDVQLAPLGAGLVFAGDGSVEGRELWFTDGTLAGTVLLAEIAPAFNQEGQPTDFVATGTRVFFVADDGVNGRELWTTDGTTSGTVMVADINPAGTSYPVGLVRVHDRVAFYASESGGWNHHDLWVSDGTAVGTYKVLDLDHSPINPSPFVVLGNEVYFAADLDAAGLELWRSDLSPGQATLVADLNPAGDTYIGTRHSAGSRIWFIRYESPDTNLYVSDGTPGGTHVVPGTTGIASLAVLGASDGVYFTKHAGPGSLAFTDGASVTTFCVGTTLGAFANTNVDSLAHVGGALYLRADLVNAGKELAFFPDPGAHVVDLGLGRSSLVLEADAPVLGGVAKLRAFGSPPAKVSVLAMSNPLDEPWSYAAYGDQAIWLGPASLVPLGVFSVSSWTKEVALSADPALIGFAVNVQALSVDASTGGGPELSNGLRLVLGM